jgi:hypothetical protein
MSRQVNELIKIWAEQSSELEKLLDKDGPMITVSFQLQEEVFDYLKCAALSRGFTGFEPLIREYIGDGLRSDVPFSKRVGKESPDSGKPAKSNET